ncbi:MAG: ABC transporter permease [Vicinamibacteria bacterium]
MNSAQLAQDLRVAARSLVREKSFTVAALLSLALGIGANTALFSVLYGVLLRPLPYQDPGRLVRLSEYHPGATTGIPGSLFTNFTFNAWKDAKTIGPIAGFSTARFTESSGPEPVRVYGATVSPEAFDLLGVTPVKGRLLVAEDAQPGAPRVVVISEGLWKERFDSDPRAVGKTLTLNGNKHEIVGIAPAAFYFPERRGQIWTPFRIPEPSADPKKPSIWIFGAVARLKPDATIAQAAEEGTNRARGGARAQLADAIFGVGGPVTVRVESLLGEMTARVRPALLVFAVGVGFILLIACSNVASLQLTRGVARQREMAVRTALGASRLRLVTQLATESLLLAAGGGILGLFLGWALLAVLPSIAPANFPRLDDIALDGRALLFAALISLGAGVIASVLPALRSSTTKLAPALRDGAGASAGAATQRWRAAFVMSEAALAVILLIGAGLLVRSLNALLNVDPGYSSDGVLIARIDSGGRPVSAEKSRQLADGILARLRSLPGVAFAGAGNMTPLDSTTAISSFDLPADGAPGGVIKARATAYVMTPGYAEALSIRLKEGRMLGELDETSSLQTILVNEEFVRTYLTDGKPVLGRRFTGLVEDVTPPVTTEIVGVVRNTLKNGPSDKPLTEIFMLPRFDNALSASFSLVVKARGDASSLAQDTRSIIRGLDPTVTVDTVTLARRAESAVAQPRFAAFTVTAFALLALTLSAAGLFGAMSYAVSQRRREMGVRTALGASRSDIVSLILRQGLFVTGAGLVIGLIGAIFVTRSMDKLLFGVAPLDPLTFIAAPTLLLAAAIAACIVPAWRGAAVPPTEALRCE